MKLGFTLILMVFVIMLGACGKKGELQPPPKPVPASQKHEVVSQ